MTVGPRYGRSYRWHVFPYAEGPRYELEVVEEGGPTMRFSITVEVAKNPELVRAIAHSAIQERENELALVYAELADMRD